MIENLWETENQLQFFCPLPESSKQFYKVASSYDNFMSEHRYCVKIFFENTGKYFFFVRKFTN
jgi:hypothetical protein